MDLEWDMFADNFECLADAIAGDAAADRKQSFDESVDFFADCFEVEAFYKIIYSHNNSEWIRLYFLNISDRIDRILGLFFFIWIIFPDENDPKLNPPASER